jgi:hypothetical protein
VEKRLATSYDIELGRALDLFFRGGFAASAFDSDSGAMGEDAIESPMGLRRTAAPERNLAAEIDWDRLANALLAGDLSGLTDAQRKAVLRLARSKSIVDLANAAGTNPVQIAIALLAETVQNRTAQRLARRTLAKTPEIALARARAQTGRALSEEGTR